MTTTLSSPWHLYLMAVGACAAFGGWAWFSMKKSGPSLSVAAKLLLATVAGPIWIWQLAQSSIELEQATIRWTTGYPWSPKAHSVNFAGVRSISRVEVGSGRNRRELWILTFPDGARREVGITDTWRANLEEISKHLGTQGIEIPK